MANLNTTISPTLNFVIISVYSISIPIAIVGIVGNCIVVLAYLKIPPLRTEGPQLIGELAAGDLLFETGYLIATISRITIHGSYDLNSLNKFTCISLSAISTFGSYISQLYSLFVAEDRFRAMSQPIQYFNRNASDHHPLRKFVLVCIFSFLSTSFFYVGIDLNAKSPLCAGGPSMHKVVALYFTVFMFSVGAFVIYYYVRAVISLKYLKKNTVNLGTQANKERARTEMKITETVVIILVAFILVWFMPNTVSLIVGTYYRFGHSKPFLPVPYLGVLLSINSAINVFVYAAKSSIIKPYLIATMKCKNINAVTATH